MDGQDEEAGREAELQQFLGACQKKTFRIKAGLIDDMMAGFLPLRLAAAKERCISYSGLQARVFLIAR